MKMTKIVLGSLLALALGSLAYAADLPVDGNIRASCGTASATAGAATLNNKCGVVTTEATTFAATGYTLTLTNSVAAAGDIVTWSIDQGSSTQTDLTPQRATPNGGSVVFTIKGSSVTGFANGTVRVRYLIIKP